MNFPAAAASPRPITTARPTNRAAQATPPGEACFRHQASRRANSPLNKQKTVQTVVQAATWDTHEKLKASSHSHEVMRSATPHIRTIGSTNPTRVPPTSPTAGPARSQDRPDECREEIIVLVVGDLRIHHNPAKDPHPKRPRLWDHPWYRRSMMTHDYYCP